MSPETRSHIEHVKLFLRWNGERFDDLDKVHPANDDAPGWRRCHEFWIKPNVWREIFDNNPDVAVGAARTLREAGLLRVQDAENCQAVVIVRKKSVRAYVIKAQILEWQPTEPYGVYVAANIELPYELKTAPSLAQSDGQPPALSVLLNDGTRLALQRAIELLAISPDPGDRNYAAQLRGQTTLINTLISTQARVDEAKFREQQKQDALARILAELKAWPD
jgi:hypothetical protein